MIRAFYAASTGLKTMQNGLDVVANNVANLETEGYKAGRADFTELITANLNERAGVETRLKAGVGAGLGGVNISFVAGPRINTARPLDHVIDSDQGFFAIQYGDGSIRYTRAGDFQQKIEGKNGTLVSSDGGYVLSASGAHIQLIDTTPVPPKLDADGNPIEDKKNNKEKVQVKPGVFTFPNNSGLEQAGGTTFIATANSGQAVASKTISVTNGVLESSGASMAQEMSNAMQLQRAFQFNSRMVQMSDEMMQNINTLR